MRIFRRCVLIALILTGTVLAAFFVTPIALRRSMAVTPVAGSKSLVRCHPLVPIVFTSRTEPASLEASSPESEPFREPVRVPWAAREGRLRLLSEDGSLFELTHGRRFPDGSSLIDVMSPSITLDGRRALFAGRTTTNPRWRIYEVAVDGSGLRQLTGGPDDTGCIAVPPLRYRADGSKIPDEERKRTDYDDIDPTDLGPNGLAFASSRLPDLGRDHGRRATQIWILAPETRNSTPLTANRNNDRWPVLIAGTQVLFSLWSRNREAVAADRSGVVPVSEGEDFATRPAENWMAAIVSANAAQFGYAIKSREPVWRPRPLFNGRIAFMTTSGSDSTLRLAQADWGYIRTSPSSLAAGEDLSYEGGAELWFGPTHDAEGRPIVAACPSALPDHELLFAGSPAGSSPAAFGIFTVSDDWQTGTPTPRLVFDDPSLVDAEPVAVYTRQFVPEPKALTAAIAQGYGSAPAIKLESGATHTGLSGYIENLAIGVPIRNPIPWHDRSEGKRVDPRANPLVSPPPNVAAVAIYAAGRDRFDDPDRLRVPGQWERQLVMPVASNNRFTGWVPSDPLSPSVLVGLDAEGKVAQWTRPASGNRPAQTSFAYAGDHYSGIRPNGYHYCNGCHTGHTFIVLDPRERTGK